MSHEKQLKIDTLSFTNRVLQAVTAALKDTVSTQRQTIAARDKQIDNGRVAAAEANEKVRVATLNQRKALDLLSDKDVKYRALMIAYKNGEITKAALRDSITSNPIFSEPEWNRIYVRITGERDAYKAVLDTTARALGVANERVSELEIITNKLKLPLVEAENKWNEEVATKRFLGGIGKNSRKNAARRNAQYYRTKREQKVTL